MKDEGLREVVVADLQNLGHFAPLGEVVPLPCSYRALHAACRACASASMASS